MNLYQPYLAVVQPTPGIAEEDYLRFAIIQVIGLFALAIHVLLIPVFAWLQLYSLSFLNCGSVFILLMGLRANRRGRHNLAVLLVCAEVLLHSVITTLVIGLAAGFQHYLWAVAALAVLNTKLSYLRAITYSAAFIVTFAILYVFAQQLVYTPLAPYVSWMHFANVLIAGFPYVTAIVVIRFITLYQERKLIKLASLDSLTTLANRRYIAKLAQSRLRQNPPVSLVLGDIDYFKQVNDRCGHAEGDQVLCLVADFLRRHIRDSDLIGRWGGEEFLLVLPNTTGQVALERIDSIRQALQAEFSDRGGITMSFGVVQCSPGLELDQCLIMADQAMYQSKLHGRNCATLYPHNLAIPVTTNA